MKESQLRYSSALAAPFTAILILAVSCPTPERVLAQEPQPAAAEALEETNDEGLAERSNSGKADEPAMAKIAINQARALSMAFRQAAKTAGPAVITIVTQVSKYTSYSDGVNPPVERLEHEDTSIGSGLVIHKSGIVLTNSHVLEGADRTIVRTADGREFQTYDVRRDKKSDVAILRIRNPPKLRPAILGNSDQVDVGDWVIAIGNPFEFDTTVSAGIISGKNRLLDKIKRGKLLQTDAAINPGNSGGPLVDLEGKVIGINTAIASKNGGYQGVGFAIPINNARWVVNQLAKHGAVRRGYLGVTCKPFTPADAARANLPPIAGVIVTSVKPATPAERGGIQLNDVIVEFAGMRIRDQRDLQSVVERKPVGSTQTVKITRGGQTERLEVVVDELRN